MTEIINRKIPVRPRSKNYAIGTTVSVGGGTTIIQGGGGGDSVEIVKELDQRTLNDSNVLSSLRTLLEIRDRIVKRSEIKELTDDNTLSSLRTIEAIDTAITSLSDRIEKEIADMLIDVESNYLSKTKPDNALELITFLKGLKSADLVTLLKGLHVEGGADIDNLHVLEALTAKLVDAVRVSATNADIQQANIVNAIIKKLQSAGYTSGPLGSGLFFGVDEDGNTRIEVDNALIRKEAIFNKLTIAELQSVGGQIVLSIANMECLRVENMDGFYRCYFDNQNGTITNKFALYDQARCQTFDGSKMKYYWRLVIGVGADYIDLSKTDSDGTSIPEARDSIVQLGNRVDASRQNAIILSAYGVPSIKQYDGIHSYSLDGCEVTVISPEGNKFTGDFSIVSGDKKVRIPADLGVWSNGMACRYYDRVSYNGALWLCLVEEGSSTTSEPRVDNPIWQKQVSEGGTGYRNLLNWQETWKEGSLPSGWDLNGKASENSVVLGSNPFGAKSLLWKCTPDTSSGDSGGPAGGYITPHYALDNEHTYRYTAFVYREKASKGNIFHGCIYTDNLSGGANDNPYFVFASLPAGKWLLLVGYIHPSKADTKWQMSTSGIYDMSGKKIYSGTDYKLRNPNVRVTLRSYLYNTDNPADVAYFYNPRLEVCDGNEPSIEQLLQVSVKDVEDKVDTMKTTYDTEFIKTKEQIALKANSSTVSALGSRLNSAEAKITADAINLTVKSQVTKASQDAQAYADYKVTAEERRAIADAQTKLNQSLAASEKAKQDAINDAAKKFPTLTEYEAGIKTLADRIEQRVTRTTFDTAISDAQLLAKALSKGKMLYEDATFKNGSNSVETYINNGGGAVSITREKTDDAPNDSGHCLKINVFDGANLQLGGFYFGTQTKANRMMLCRFVAKIPNGQEVVFTSNYAGSGTAHKWLTPNVGTGRWEEYAYYMKCGETGTFSSTFFFFLKRLANQTYPITWYLAYATVFDLNANEIFTPLSTYETKITQLSDSISLTATGVEKINGRLVKAESEILQTPNKIALAVSGSEEKIKSSLTLDSSGISLLGKKIALTGAVTFSSLAPDAQGKVNTAQSTANSASSKADAAQGTANTANSGLSTLKSSLKDLAYQDKVSLAKLDETIVEGGYLKTNLIDANAIVTSSLIAEKIAATDITTSRLTVTDGAKIGRFTVKGGSLCSGIAGTSNYSEIGFSESDGRLYFDGDMQHQGTKGGRSLRFLTADLWCRGEFGHREMTFIEVNKPGFSNIFCYVYGGPSRYVHNSVHPEAGKAVDIIVLKGESEYVLRVVGASEYKRINIANKSGSRKRILIDPNASATTYIEPWTSIDFIVVSAKQELLEGEWMSIAFLWRTDGKS